MCAREAAATAEAIYQAYPRKVAKPAAIRCIAKALASPPLGIDLTVWPALLLQITVRFADARKGEDPQFTPHPSTWFHQRRFEDDPATWKTEPAAQHSRFGQPSESERRAAVIKETERIRTLAPSVKPVAAQDRVSLDDLRAAKNQLQHNARGAGARDNKQPNETDGHNQN